MAGPRRGEAELLGRVPARRAAVLLQPGGELRRHELLLQLRRRQRSLVNPVKTFHQLFRSDKVPASRETKYEMQERLQEVCFHMIYFLKFCYLKMMS